MSTREVTLDGGSPWGFRMHGGADAQQPLRIARVNPGSKAAQRGIREGDLISSINGQSTRGITNSEAHALLKNAGDTLVLGLNQETTGSPKRRVQKQIQESKEETLKRTSITSTSSFVNNTSTINRTVTNSQQSNESTHTNGVSEHKDSEDTTNNFQSYIKNGTPYTTPRGASNDEQSRDTSNDDTARNHSSIHSNESVAGDDSVITALRDNTLLAATIMADNVCGSSRSRNKRRSRSNRKRSKKCNNSISNQETQENTTTNVISDEQDQSNNNQINEQSNSASTSKLSENNINDCEKSGAVFKSDSSESFQETVKNITKIETCTEINNQLLNSVNSATKSKKLDSVMVMVSPDSDICIVEFPKTKPKINSSITICEISDDEHNTQENNYNVNIASDNEIDCDKISDIEAVKATQQVIKSKNLNTHVTVPQESSTKVLDSNKLCDKIDFYQVEYPKPVLERKNSNNGIVKSRSLDDDEQLKITELTDDEKSSACVSESQAIVSEASEAESDVEWETTAELAMQKETSGQQFGKMTVISLPLEEHVTYETSHISPEDERSLRDFLEGLNLVNSPEESVKRIETTSSSNTESVKMKRAKKRAALAQHFMPYYQNPRYLDVISEEGSDLSDRDNKQSKSYKTQIIDTDDDDDVFEDMQAKYRNKFQSCYAGTNERAILVGTKLIDHDNATLKEATWSTSMIDAPSGAEVVYLEDSSNSMTPSDLLDETTGDLDADDEEDISIDWDKTCSDSLDIEHSASETSLIKNDNSVRVSPDTASRVPQSKDEQIELNVARQPTPPPTPNTPANDTTEELKASNKTSIDFPQPVSPNISNNNIVNDTFISLNDEDSPNSSADIKTKSKISDGKELMVEIKVEEQSINENEEELSKEFKNLCECLKKPSDEYSSQIDSTPNVSRSDSTTSSRSTSQCTAFYNPLHSSLTNIAAMLREGSFDDKVERLAPAPLREICVRALLSMPFGKDIIEELANVSQSIEEMTCRTPSHVRPDEDSTEHNKSLSSSAPLPIPPPVPPRTSSKPNIDASSILLVDTPVVRTPPQKMERWIGMPTEENPNLLVCLSPSQKEFIDKTKTFANEADSLLDLHRKYIERRGYHEEHEHAAPTSPKKDGHTVPAFKIKIDHQNNNNENNLLKIIHNAGADTINNNDMYLAYNTNLNYNNYVKQFTREIPMHELKPSDTNQEPNMKHGNIRYDKYIKQLTREVPIQVEKQINKPVNNKIYSAALSNENTSSTSSSNRLNARHLGEWLNLARNECDRINNSTEHIRELHNLHSSVNKLVSQHSCEERSSNSSDATFKRGTSPRRYTLPFNLYEQQMQYILEKEREIEQEIEKLKEEKSSLESHEKMNANHINIPVQHEFTKRESANYGNTFTKNEKTIPMSSTSTENKSKFHSTDLFKELHVTPTRPNVTHEKNKEHIIPIHKETEAQNPKPKSENNNKHHFDFTIPEFKSFMEEKSKFERNENFNISFHREEKKEEKNYFEKVKKSEEHHIPIRKEYDNKIQTKTNHNNKNHNIPIQRSPDDRSSKYENTDLFKELHVGLQLKPEEHIIPIHKEFDAGKYQISRKGDIAILNPEEKLSPKLTQPTTVSEKFRQEMYNEYMCKIAERQERKQNKVIKIQISPKPKEDEKVSAAMSPQYEVKHVTGIEDEFMNKVREKKGKLEDEDSENDEEKSTIQNDLPPVKIIDGSSSMTDAKQLPKHLQEFIDYTTTANTDDGVWSPGKSAESTPSVISHEKPERKASPPKDLKCGEPGPVVWTPRSAGSSPTAERKEFRPVSFESPTLSRKNKSKESTPAATPDSVIPIPPPWEGAPNLASTQEATTTLSSSLERKLTTSQSAPVAGLNNLGKLPRAQNPTITLLQKAREGQLPRGASYIEDPQQNSQKPRSKDGRPPLIGPGEILYTVKNEYTSESDSEKPKKMADLGPRKFEGIGPTTKDGMPIVLRSIYDHPEEVKESNQAKWYKRMYDTLHRARNDDEYVTVRYKTRRGRYPYTSAAGYLSEPEPNAYDSDAGISASKYATLDRRRLQTRDKENEYITYTVPRNKYVPAASVKHTTDIYKNQPGRIENYVPGHSSISEKEAKEWWDEVMEIFDGWLDDHSALPSLNYMLSQVSTARSHLEQQKHVPPSKSFMSHALKESGYESDSTLVFRRREDAALQLSPHEQKAAYKTIQKGGEVPLHGLRKPAPERPKDDSDMEYFPISPTLTRIRIHKNNIKPVNEILCYPVTVHHQPSSQVFSAYKRTAPSSSVPPASTSNQPQPPKLPSRPPSPPKRRSSRNSHTLRLISTMTIHHSPSPKSSRRHETCFKSTADKSNVKFLRDKISCKLKSPTTARKNVKVTKTISSYPSTSRESIITSLSTSKDAKGTSNTIKSKTDITTCKHKELDQHYSRSTASSAARRCCRHCSFSVPPKITDTSKTLDKSKPRAISLERTFGTEKRKVDLTLPKLSSLDQRLIKSPDLVSPTEVKKTLQKQKVLLDQKYPPGTTIKKSTSLFSSAKNGLKTTLKPDEKSLNVTVAYSAKGRELLSTSPKSPIKSVKTSSPVMPKVNRNLISPVPSNISDKSKSSSKSRALSTESLSSPTVRKRTVPVKPATISRIKSTNTLSKDTSLLNNDKKKSKKVKKDQSNEELKKEKKSQKLKESKLKINDKPKTKKCAGRAAGTEIVKKLKKMTNEQENEPRISSQLIKDQQREILQSDSFFQHLFLRDMLSSPTPSISSKSSYIIEKTKMLENFHTSLPYSEPTINALKVYLSNRKPVSESKFKTLDRELVRSRSASPCILSRSFSESRNKFDSISEVSNEDTYYDSRYSSQESIRNRRSSSLPAPKIFFSETSRPVSPSVEKSIVKYRETRSPSTSPIRSPSRRKIHSIKPPASITVEGISGVKKKAVRARSAGEADALKREMYLSEKIISPAVSTASLTQIVDPQEYKNYVTELRHSVRKSDRFKELNRFYTSLERLSQLERTTSSTDLRPRRKNEEEIIDYDRWMQVRTRERAEQEFNTLYKKLKQDQKERDLLFRPKDVNQFKWKCEREFGLKIKEQSVENIKEQFEKLKVLESPMEASKRRILNYQKDVYKPLWRGNSVLNLVSKISEKRSQSESRVSAVKQRLLNEEQLLTREIGSKLWSSLSVEQVNALKNQLAEIYSQGPPPKKEDYSITVEPQSKVDRPNNLLIRRNSANEITSAKQIKRNECIKSASIGAINGHTLSENEKKKISQSLSREVKDRMSQRKKYTSSLSIVLGKETRGAIAAAEAKVKPLPEIYSPRTCYSLEPTEEDTNNKQSKTEKDFLLVLTKDESEDQKENVRQTLDKWAQSKNNKTDTLIIPAKPVSSTSETESASSDNSTKTAIFVDKKEDLHKKIEYFEKGIEETYVPTIHRPAEDDVDADITDIVPLDKTVNYIEVQKERRPSTLMTSQSYADLKELFGEKDLLKFATIPLSATRKSTITTPKRPLLRATSPIKTLSEASSKDSLIRSRSISPDTERFWNAYLSLINGVDVRKMTEKFELLKDFYSNRTVPRTHRRCKSDPELISTRNRNEREFGDVYWLKKRYENLDRSRSRIRRHGKTSPIAKTPLKAEDRLMPHINIISKLASLYPKKELSSEEKNKSVEDLAKSLGCPIGEVEKLREKFDSPDRNDVSLLGHMFTSSPNIHELRDIAPYLAGPWIAHQYPRYQDNSRSASSPDKNGSSRTLIRRDRPRPKSTSPPRTKPPSSILKSHVQQQKDIFANQFYDPRIHRPICRYQPSIPKADRSRSWSPITKHTVTFKEPVMGPTPPPKGQPFNRDSGAESPRKYVEDEVTIHYRSPVRHEIKEAISEEELARRQAEAMRRIYQEERRRKYLQELQDMNSRRHTDNFIPSQKSPISLNRYDDFIDDLSPKIKIRDRSPEPRLVARALYNFVGQSARELTFRKGDVIFIRRQVDKNWYEGEHNAMIGLFPTNYVEIIPYDGVKVTPRKANEGQARAKFNFIAQTHLELSLAKGELVVLTRRVDDNWFEGRIGNRKGIFPVSYVEILIDPSEKGEIILSSSKPVASPAAHSLLLNGSSGGKESMGSHHYQPNFSSQTTATSYHAKPVNVIGTTTSYQSITRSQKISTGPAVNEALHIDTHHSEPVPYRALYKYRPQNDDELELQEGDTVFVLEKCDDGWYVGSSQRTGAFGTFPGNYVERI